MLTSLSFSLLNVRLVVALRLCFRGVFFSCRYVVPLTKFHSPAVFIFAALSGQPLPSALQAAARCQ